MTNTNHMSLSNFLLAFSLLVMFSTSVMAYNDLSMSPTLFSMLAISIASSAVLAILRFGFFCLKSVLLGLFFCFISFFFGLFLVTPIMFFLVHNQLVVDKELSSIISTGILSPVTEELSRAILIGIVIRFSLPFIATSDSSVPISFGLGWGLSEFIARCSAALLAIIGLIKVQDHSILLNKNLLVMTYFSSTVMAWHIFFTLQIFLFFQLKKFLFLFSCILSHIFYNNIYIIMGSTFPFIVPELCSLFSTPAIFYIVFSRKFVWSRVNTQRPARRR